MFACVGVRSRAIGLLVGGALAISTSIAVAAPTLIGDSVTVTYSGVGNGTASAVAVAGPAEFTNANLGGLMLPGESINIEATSIIVTFVVGYFAPQTISIEDLDFLGDTVEIVGFMLTSGISWLTDGDISFTADSILLDVGSGATFGGTATIDLITRSTAVPEPSSIALVGLALLGAVAVRARRQKATRV